MHRGHAEGYRMVARCTEGTWRDIEWLLGAQRVCGWV